MKLCPRCQANVEGLVGHCDCCGASLDTRVRLFFCGVHDVPECLGFSTLAFQMIKEIEPAEPARYRDVLEGITVHLFCYPESILVDGNIKNRVYYSAAKKQARVTAVVSYNDFVFADKKQKAALVANAIVQGLHSLQVRLRKYKIGIDEIVTNADHVLKKYISNL